MILLFLIAAVASVLLISLSRNRREAKGGAALFFGVQLLTAVALLVFGLGDTQLKFLTFDAMGSVFFLLMALIAGLSFIHSDRYLDTESLREYRYYNIALVLLCVSAGGVYLSNNLAVTWIFLEATTLSAAGLVYHRRNSRSLEATWKYIFVCSTGIAMAYLGILLLSISSSGGDLSYRSLAEVVVHGDPLYLKIAFLFILAGYSCKLEIFPLYKIGVDANLAAPTPASAVISTVIVNAGFVAIFRVTSMLKATQVGGWVSSVLILAGLFSLLIAALYIRRTNNYKRFFAYSTIENSGLAVIGLGIGGVGAFAAIFHMIFHSLLKSGMFLQVAQIGKIYGNYRINRIGDYMKVDRRGAVNILLGTIGLTALPPSALFISEVMIFRQMIVGGKWWMAMIVVLLLCIIMYTFVRRILRLCFNPGVRRQVNPGAAYAFTTWSVMAIIVASMILGTLQPDFLVNFINSMI